MNKEIEKRSNSIEIQTGKTYITNTELKMARHDLSKGVKFKVIRIGDSWNNHTELLIISGKIRTSVHSSFFHYATKLYKGNQEFMEPEQLKQKLGMEDDIIVTFDPFNNYNSLPVKEINKGT